MTGKNDIKYLKQIMKSVGRAINRYRMIEAEDKVAVPVSGGMDSLVLLETLSLRRKHIPIHYDLTAVHIKVENIPFEIDRPYLQSVCASLGIPFHVRHIVVDHEGSGLSPCFLCSKKRRKEIFLFAKEQGCNRIAFGHHMDDVIETLFMNMAFQGAISTMPPKLSMFGGEFDIIRPLVLLSEQEVKRYAKIRNYAALKKECPFAEKTARAEIKGILKQIYKMNRKARSNIFCSMSNIHTRFLPNDGGHPPR